MPETDRLRSRKGDSAKQQGGGSKAAKKSGGSEQRTDRVHCEVHKLPCEKGGTHVYFDRCREALPLQMDVEDYVVTSMGGPKEDRQLCPKHFASFTSEGLLVVETIAECASRLRQEEGAGAQSEQQSARAPVRASPQSSARSAASTSSCPSQECQQPTQWRSGMREGIQPGVWTEWGSPTAQRGSVVGGAAAERAAAEDQCGRFASLMCSAQLCCDTLGMKVEGTHNVFWLAKCTGWSLVSTPEAPVLEMYVVTCGRAVSVSVDSVSNRTGPWQLQWIDDSLVGDARCAMPQFDGCDAAGTPWRELQGGSEWGELVHRWIWRCSTSSVACQ